MTSPERTTYPKSFRLGAPLFAAAIFLSGCTDTTDPTPRPNHTVAEDLESFIPAIADCSEQLDGLTHSEELKYAAECLTTYQNGKIALIDYDMNQAAATAFASDVEKRFDKVTDGIITIDVSVVEPSAKARKDFEAANGDCIDSNVTDDWGSAIADKDMPSLKQYDILLGESDLPSCNNTADGIAEPGSKYTQIFEANKLDGKPIVKNLGDGVTETYPHGELGFIAMHELLHEYGLGHAGTLFTGGDNLQRFLLDKKTHEIVNLESYVGKGTYYEYGDNDGAVVNIMSDAGGASKRVLLQNEGLNPIQLDRLKLPEYLVKHQADHNVLEVNRSAVTLDSSTPADAFASYTLPKAIPIPTSSSDGSKDSFASGNGESFKRLVFLPEFYNNHGKQTFDGLNAYLTTDDYEIATVALGPLYATMHGDPKTYDFTVGSHTLRVTVHNTKATIEEIE